MFLKVFHELGGEILFSEAIQQGSYDMRGVVAKVKSSNPDFVYAPTYTGEAIALLQGLKESGVSIPILGNDAWQDKTIIEIAGQAAEGIRFVAIVSSSAPEKFLAELQRRTGIENPAIIPALQAYDAVKMVAEAFEKSDGDSTKVKNELGILEYKGISNPRISFDRNGDITELTMRFVE